MENDFQSKNKTNIAAMLFEATSIYFPFVLALLPSSLLSPSSFIVVVVAELSSF